MPGSWRVAAASVSAVALWVLLTAGAAASGEAAGFAVGAAKVSFTPPRSGELADDAADCVKPAHQALFDGPRQFAFEEPYNDLQGSGHYDMGDPYLDCNLNGRWDGNFLGGGSPPRFYRHVADRVGARAIVVSNGERTIAVEVLDNEGAFNVYLQRIRRRVAADGVHLDGIYISSNHDESAPDTIGINGVNEAISSVNDYFADYMVERSAKAIELAARRMRPATIRYAEARQPANLRQCWSSYPFVDDQLMPTLQAVDQGGRVIVTLAEVSQHAESLGFNPDSKQASWISADWIHFFRKHLGQRFGGIAIEMPGSVGSVETPEVFPEPISRIPQRFVDEAHPAGCRTLFGARGEPEEIGYWRETRALGRALAASVARAVERRGKPSRSSAIWGDRKDVCIPLKNTLFTAAAAAGVFAQRPGYTASCTLASPVLPNGSTVGTEARSQVAAFRIGDGSFISVPGEVFPFTYLRGFLGPRDMPKPRYPLPPWPLPHMHTPFRFVNGLGEDMLGYIFPRGNGVGVPGEDPLDPTGEDDTDRFGCGHSDDAESTNSRTADILGRAIVRLLDSRGGDPERVVDGRYVLPDGRLSRDPLGGPEIKCEADTEFEFAGRAVAVWLTGRGRVEPAAWMSTHGRRQSRPDRNTRGYFTSSGERRWLDVFEPLRSAGPLG